MFKKLILALALLCLAVPAFAQDLVDIDVVGRGENMEDALQDAFRQAARQVFGAFVVSKTKTENAKLIEDQVLSVSQGFVRKFAVSETRTMAGEMVMDVKVTLDRANFEPYVVRLGKDGLESSLNDYEALRQVHQKRQEEKRMLQAMFGDPTRFVDQAYDFDLVSVEATDVGPDSLSGTLKVRVTRNDLFFEQYLQMLEAMACESGETITEGLISSPKEFFWPYYEFVITPQTESRVQRPWSAPIGPGYAGIFDGYRVPATLKAYLPTRPAKVSLKIGPARHEVLVLKNAMIISEGRVEEEFSKKYFLLVQDEKKFPATRLSVEGLSPEFRDGRTYMGSDPSVSSFNVTALITEKTFLIRVPFKVGSPEQLRKLESARPEFTAEWIKVPKHRIRQYDFSDDYKTFEMTRAQI